MIEKPWPRRKKDDKARMEYGKKNRLCEWHKYFAHIKRVSCNGPKYSRLDTLYHDKQKEYLRNVFQNYPHHPLLPSKYLLNIRWKKSANSLQTRGK
jgi:hypothetical protein